MSADNAVYIASFPNGTYRVSKGSLGVSFMDEIDSDLVTPEEARDHIQESFPLGPFDRDQAHIEALLIKDAVGYTEYGILDYECPVNFGELREPAPPWKPSENACPHCSSRYSEVWHGGPCDRDPARFSYKLYQSLLKERSINAGYIRRIVMEMLEQHLADNETVIPNL